MSKVFLFSLPQEFPLSILDFGVNRCLHIVGVSVHIEANSTTDLKFSE